jgi:hypothetical protein
VSPLSDRAGDPAGVGAHDDLFHDPGDHPYWNESAWFGFMVPERRLNGWVYLWHRPNMQLSAGGVALWDPTGEEIHNCLYYELNSTQSLPRGAEMFDARLDNGLSVECLDPLTSYRLGFKNEGCELDLSWEGVLPVRALHYSGNPGVEAWAQGHYEQSGRVRGTVRVEDETLTVDCLSNRDHSWGPRLPGSSWKRGGYEWANASATNSFGVTSLSGLPFDADPVVGATEKVAHGWYNRDGVIGELVSGERRVVERGGDGRPLRVVLKGKDHLGRELHAEGRPENLLKWLGPCFVFWSLAKWEFDGQEGWGEIQDFLQPRQSRRLGRSLRSGPL